MGYTVEDLSMLAKVSVRTLHYYDEINLLKPSVRMTNGKRYYGEEHIVKLMDIVFFKKLGFSLKKIESMLNLGNKDKRALLIAKKEFLKKEIKKTRGLISAIDITLELCFKGENLNYRQIIKQFELFQKTTQENKRCLEKEFGSLEDEETEKLKKMSVKDQKKYFENKYEKIDMKQYSDKMTACLKKLEIAIENNQEEASIEVQNIMQEYYKIINMVHPMSKKKWLRMVVTIGENKEIYNMYAKMHPRFPEFFVKAIKIYGENLSE